MDGKLTARGYAFAAAAAALFALNSSLARYLIDDGVGALPLSELRAVGSFLLLAATLALLRPGLLRVRRADLPALALLGVAGLALVQVTYFLAIARLPIGVALTIQYLGPLLVLVWLRVAHGRHLSRGLWGAVALSLVGCFLVVRAYEPAALDAIGVGWALGAAVTLAVYLVLSERAGRTHEPATTLVWALGFASLAWLIAAPPFDFPWHAFAEPRRVLLALAVIVIGTLLPFGLIVAAVRHIPASRAAIVATLEPVLAAGFAWVLHGERLAPIQLVGGAAVVLAVVWVQGHRLDFEAESAPSGGWTQGALR